MAKRRPLPTLDELREQVKAAGFLLKSAPIYHTGDGVQSRDAVVRINSPGQPNLREERKWIKAQVKALEALDIVPHDWDWDTDASQPCVWTFYAHTATRKA